MTSLSLMFIWHCDVVINRELIVVKFKRRWKVLLTLLLSIYISFLIKEINEERIDRKFWTLKGLFVVALLPLEGNYTGFLWLWSYAFFFVGNRARIHFFRRFVVGDQPYSLNFQIFSKLWQLGISNFIYSWHFFFPFLLEHVLL